MLLIFCIFKEKRTIMNIKKTTLITSLLLTFSLPSFSFGRHSDTEKIIQNYDKIKEKQAATHFPKSVTVIKNIPYYSASDENKLDIYFQKNDKRNKPVIVMIHGGAWVVGDKTAKGVVSNKVNFFVDQKDYIFVSINYRMDKNSIHPQEVEDVSRAISWIVSNIQQKGGDPTKLIIMGHSAGAHLAALVSTDLKYLAKENVPIEFIKGVIPLDGGGFDIPYLLNSDEIKKDMGGGIKTKLLLKKVIDVYGIAWGQYDINILNDASPIFHVSKKTPPLLLIESSKNITHQLVADRFQKVLNSSNVKYQRYDYDLKHEEINDFVGKPHEHLTKVIDEFISSVLSK